jgi:ribosomal-protein-serine acetyltransferase
MYLKVDHEIELHLFQVQHASELFFLVEKNRGYLRKWLPWVDGMKSISQFYQVIHMWKEQYEKNLGLQLAIRYKGKLAGGISLHGVDWLNSQASIGYYITESMQGKGIITRAVKSLLHLAFHDLALNRMEIRCGKENFKSQAIPVKLGFTKEGIMRDGEFLNGKFHDLIVFSLLSKDWQHFNLNK